MPVTVTQTDLPGVLIVEPKVFGDSRGFFFESFNAAEFAAAAKTDAVFVQDNHSKSAKGVLRGLHYQIRHAQGKLVRVVSGEALDVAVDLRRSSPHFGKWTSVILSAENRRQLWVPPGFGHGFLVVSGAAEVLYKATDYWRPEHERTIAWNDPGIGIDWRLGEHAVGAPVLSAKDAMAAPLAAAEVYD